MIKPEPVPLSRRLVAEGLGTALLVTVVVGSGIAAAALSPSDVGLQLLENSTATALGLAVLILIFGPVSGAHFNPLVSAADWLLGRRSGTGLVWGDVIAYTAAQILGGIVGAQLYVAAPAIALGPDTTDHPGVLEHLQVVRRQVGPQAQFGGQLPR